MQGNAPRAHAVCDQAARLIVETAQNLRAAIVQGHFDTQTVQDAGKFARDIAAADDQDGFGQLIKVKDVIRHDAKVRIGQIGPHRMATCGDKNMFRRFGGACFGKRGHT